MSLDNSIRRKKGIASRLKRNHCISLLHTQLIVSLALAAMSARQYPCLGCFGLVDCACTSYDVKVGGESAK
jgi:hypothetical protein